MPHFSGYSKPYPVYRSQDSSLSANNISIRRMNPPKISTAKYNFQKGRVETSLITNQFRFLKKLFHRYVNNPEIFQDA